MKVRPVGTFRTSNPPRSYDEALETGDKVRLATGEELMVIAVCSTGWLFQSLNGRGKPLLTAEELLELGADGI